jgi:hypothetical protein
LFVPAETTAIAKESNRLYIFVNGAVVAIVDVIFCNQVTTTVSAE